jgi:hypothetical protein
VAEVGEVLGDDTIDWASSHMSTSSKSGSVPLDRWCLAARSDSGSNFLLHDVLRRNMLQEGTRASTRGGAAEV